MLTLANTSPRAPRNRRTPGGRRSPRRPGVVELEWIYDTTDDPLLTLRGTQVNGFASYLTEKSESDGFESRDAPAAAHERDRAYGFSYALSEIPDEARGGRVQSATRRSQRRRGCSSRRR